MKMKIKTISKILDKKLHNNDINIISHIISYLTDECCFYGCKKVCLTDTMMECEDCGVSACKKCGNNEFQISEYENDDIEILCYECVSDRRYDNMSSDDDW